MSYALHPLRVQHPTSQSSRCRATSHRPTRVGVMRQLARAWLRTAQTTLYDAGFQPVDDGFVFVSGPHAIRWATLRAKEARVDCLAASSCGWVGQVKGSRGARGLRCLGVCFFPRDGFGFKALVARRVVRLTRRQAIPGMTMHTL